MKVEEKEPLYLQFEQLMLLVSDKDAKNEFIVKKENADLYYTLVFWAVILSGVLLAFECDLTGSCSGVLVALFTVLSDITILQNYVENLGNIVDEVRDFLINADITGQSSIDESLI